MGWQDDEEPTGRGTMAESAADAPWATMLARAKEIAGRDGGVVSAAVSADGRQVGQWLARQRLRLRAGTLEAERIAKLDDAVPDWRDGKRRGRLPDDDRWSRLLAAAVAVARRTGGVLTTATVDDLQVGQWLATQRKEDRAGSLRSDRRQRLDEELPGWTARAEQRHREEAWAATLVLAEQAYAELGAVPVTAERDDVRVGIWLSNQRQQLRRGRLARSRVAALDAAIPGWSGTKDTPRPESSRGVSDVVDGA
ncbi:helicase associated domain-containing protein [Curtobacterium sp. 20TX0008]|uniref:helicase associated domain-containing protein n=1 Tax=Curtobacterium sp. 20TX0008 TaxID=3022018 RepID=UPI00232E760A|nr:helicase associated domain-containing protein [Curtobacterium sp. 20TX0008]MDB6425939.1 helicase associated domain-containing protein [Curtobacterium sp. 20TX0008]